MDPARPATSDLHGALVGALLAAGAAWLALSAMLADWAWDGAAPLIGRSGSGAALLASACAGGVAAAGVAALLGAIKGRRVRLSMLASLTAAQLAALVFAGALAAYLWLGGSLADALLPASLAGAAIIGAASTGAVMLVPRHEA